MANKNIIGHDFQRGILNRAVRENLISHSYLFSGPDGIGKKLVAAEFAKIVNCKSDGEKGAPDCNCGSCAKVEKGIHPDVIYVEFQGVKSIKVEQIREGVEGKLYLKSFEGKYKVVIVDEADRMSNGAQNAFLKTLEEPPPSTVIILVTSNPDSLLPTIRSRCQLIKFNPLPEQLILDELRNAGELSREDAVICSKLSKGSLGKALTINEDAINWRKELIGYLIQLKPDSAMRVVSLAEYMPLGSTPEDMEKMIQTFEFISYWLRDILILKTGGDESLITNIDLIEQSREVAASWEIDNILGKMEAVQSAWSEIYNLNVNKQLSFENLFIRLAS